MFNGRQLIVVHISINPSYHDLNCHSVTDSLVVDIIQCTEPNNLFL